MAGPQNISEADIRRQIERILQSRGLESSPRLQAFLEYIVDEHLAGRAGRIKGVTIAQAVYGADDSFDPESNSIVRVEAGRLRRRLEQYYLAKGATDPIIIEIPKGGYAPTFRRRQNIEATGEARGQEATPSRRQPGKKPFLAAIALLAIALFASWTWFANYSADRPEQRRGQLPQLAVQSESEADVLARQAWELLMPPEDLKRLQTSIELFDHVIELAPNRPLGYIGKSVSISFGVLFIKSAAPASDLSISLELAQKAISMDDRNALGWAAMALSQSLAGETKAALSSARKAVADMPSDAITPTIVGLVLLNSDRPEDATDLMLDVLSNLPPQPRTPFLNVLGVARYVTGDYQGAAESFEKNLADGGPWGPHLDLFLAATYGELGQDFRAGAILERVAQKSPDFPTREWLARFIKRPEQLEATMDTLRRLGLFDTPS